MPERGGAVEVEPLAVRPSMRQAGRHPRQDAAIGSPTVAGHETGDATHGVEQVSRISGPSR